MLITLLLLILSVFIIWRACDAFDLAANLIGRNMSGGVRGATLNAAGSSMPELVTLLIGILVFSDKDGIAVGIGTIAGSAIYNIAVIPALSIIAALVFAKVSAVGVTSSVIRRDAGWLVAIQVVFVALLALSMLGLLGGLVLTALYLMYVGYLLWSTRSGVGDGDDEPSCAGEPASRLKAISRLEFAPAVLGRSSPDNLIQAWSLLVIAVAAIGLACYLLVEAVYRLGEAWSIQPYFVAVIIAAAATSIPDTLLSVSDAMRGQYDDAISNAVGSNIFNISFGIGFPVVIVALSMGVSSNLGAETLNGVVPLLVLLVPIYAVIGWILSTWALTIRTSLVLIAIYLAYVAFIVGQAMDWVSLPVFFS